VGTRRMRAPPSAEVHPGSMHRWWLDRPMRAKGMVVIAVPLIALIAVSSASLALEANERQERSVSMTASALTAAAQQVLVDAVNAETGVRGYAATRDALFLQPYTVSVTRFAGDQAALRAAAIAEGDSRAERTLAATATAEMAELANLRSAISAGASATALTPALENGKTTMDRLRRQTAALDQGPAAIHTARHADIIQMESTISWVSIAGLALGVLAGLIGVALCPCPAPVMSSAGWRAP
jgi:CHASE3 domain sensor protein